VGTIATLPVKLVSFSGSIVDHAVKLSWISAGESLLDHYEIQRSADGVTFETIANVTPQNSNNFQKLYNYIDKQLLNKGYYRLKLVDEDGKFTYSNIIVLEVITKEMIVYYNNEQSLLTIKAAASQTEKIKISVVNMEGKRILQQERIINQGNNELNLRMKSFTAGIYIVEVARNGERKVIKINKGL
jgi:hypothetical protein